MIWTDLFVRHRIILTMVAVSTACVMSPVTAHGEVITLRAAVDTALAKHPALARANAQIDGVHSEISFLESAYRPRVSASSQLRDSAQQTSSAGLFHNFSYSASVGISQLITDTGRTASAVAGTRATEAETLASRRTTRLDLELAVTQAYLDILRADALADVSQRGITLAQEQLRRARALFTASLRPEIDVLSAETQLAQEQLALLQDQNATADAKLKLLAAMGIAGAPPLDVVPVEIGPVQGEPRPAAMLVQSARERLPEFVSAEARVTRAQANVRSAQAAFAPLVLANGGAFLSGTDSNWRPVVGMFVSLGMNADLYTGGAQKYGTKAARAGVRVAQFEAAELGQNVATKVARAALQVRTAREVLVVATSSRVQAERQLKMATARYKTRVGNFVELNDARRGLITVGRQEVQARFTLASSRAALAREIGLSPTTLTVDTNSHGNLPAH